jgi:hypothetical protein
LSGHDEEKWADIPGWPHQASTHGRIRRKPWRDAQDCLHLGGELAQCPDKRKGKGYLYATLRDGQRRRKGHVAVLVLEAHRKPKPGPGYEACHGNGIRTDNRLCNLRWDTKEANLAQMWEERRSRQAVTTGSAKPGETGRGRYGSQVRRRGGGALPSRHRVTAAVTGDGPHGTGSLRPVQSSSSVSAPVQPRSRSLRSLLSPRNRQAA